MNRVLVLAKDGPTTKAVVQYLTREQLYPALVGNLREALDTGAELRPDAYIIDWEHNLASGPVGERLVSGLKQSHRAPLLALLLLTGEIPQQVPLGADDFVSWPGNYRELGFRIKRLIWKHKPFTMHQIVSSGNLAIDQNCWEVSLAGRPVELTYKEYQLLVFLMTHPGQVFSRDDLLREVWGQEYFGGTRTVDVHIRKLRSKIEVNDQSYIDTVRNVGYRFKN